MSHLFRDSFEAIPFLLTTLHGWAIIAATVATCTAARFLARRERIGKPRGSAIRFVADSLLLAVAPLTISGVGLVFWAAPGTISPHPHERFANVLVDCLLLMQIMILGWFMWRHAARLLATTTVAVLAALWTFGAQFMTTMAVSGDWI